MEIMKNNVQVRVKVSGANVIGPIRPAERNHGLRNHIQTDMKTNIKYEERQKRLSLKTFEHRHTRQYVKTVFNVTTDNPRINVSFFSAEFNIT